MKKTIVLTSIFCLIHSLSFAQNKKTNGKIQEIEFNEMDLNGKSRSPDGAYLVQRTGIQFLPLHDLKQNFDLQIRNTHQLIK